MKVYGEMVGGTVVYDDDDQDQKGTSFVCKCCEQQGEIECLEEDMEGSQLEDFPQQDQWGLQRDELMKETS